ncbi:MAG: radical SAM protein [Bacteroidetes bacterium CG02_land_8_20_14_3_00_31_25]|nr:radical SAM protein [Bacteroidota bacterium]PIV58018.1 MAG: radical SAM protein [Bacteroidetes bacterium CG02_land_8_20_14_3_00_31_25]PIX36152.1 MAG: radical SAM protein [Bacteroidetes bacterium CG_4_8_14_3_um_filter_31_14]
MFRKSFPIEYSEPLFRPPSEADSLILQITNGCTWNKCSFCEMYSTKKFSVKKEEDIFKEIEEVSELIPDIRKIFLADGNPMVLSTEKLKRILDKISKTFPKVRRVTTYALPRDIISKTPEELKLLQESGLKMIYVGIESGDDEVLKFINKGETYNSTVEGLLKAKEAGIKLSVIILEGVGGLKYSEQHAIKSAKILNAIQPEFASVLVLSFPYGIEHYKQKFLGNYIPMTISNLLKEMRIFVENIQLQNTIFRSNHASNYLVLNGILNRDKLLFLDKIDFAIKNPEIAGLRKEWQRGL